LSSIAVFLRRVIYAGLKDLNTGFDSASIGHFFAEDFLIVIDRCEALNVEVIGIEVFTTDVEPPWKVGLLDTELSPVTPPWLSSPTPASRSKLIAQIQTRSPLDPGWAKTNCRSGPL
jgi:hypothetical protein